MILTLRVTREFKDADQSINSSKTLLNFPHRLKQRTKLEHEVVELPVLVVDGKSQSFFSASIEMDVIWSEERKEAR